MIQHTGEFEKELVLRGLAPSSIGEMIRDLEVIFKYLSAPVEKATQEDLTAALLGLKEERSLKNVVQSQLSIPIKSQLDLPAILMG